MAKSRSKKKKLAGNRSGKVSRRTTQQKQRRQGGSERNPALDMLRGLAIVLMVVDHILWALTQIPIEPYSARFFTRLSMPLFCVLSGYLAIRSSSHPGFIGFRWRRFAQLATAAVVMNVIYYYLCDIRQLEILASLFVGHLAIGALGRYSVFLVGAVLLFPLESNLQLWSHNLPLFDYPISVVACCLGVGALLRVASGKVGMIAAAAIWLAIQVVFYSNEEQHKFVSTPTVYVLQFLPLAVALLCLSIEWRTEAMKRFATSSFGGWLKWIGQRPLTAYLLQYAVILALRELLK